MAVIRKDKPLELTGCSDHNCIIAKPKGMGTNGGCQCAKELRRSDVGFKVLRKMAWLESKLAAKEAEVEVEALREAAQAVVASMRVCDFPSGKHYCVETCDPAKMNALAALLREGAETKPGFNREAMGAAISQFFDRVDNGDGTLAFDHCDSRDIDLLVDEILSCAKGGN